MSAPIENYRKKCNELSAREIRLGVTCLICKCLVDLPDETPVGMEPICDLCIARFSEQGEVMLRDGDILRISNLPKPLQLED